MRGFLGTFFIVVLIGFFSLLFMGTTEEIQQVTTVNDVLDQNIDVSNIQLPDNSVITDKNGNVISEIYKSENRIYLPFDDIPQVVIDALLSAEDQSFFEHNGFDLKGITRAFLINLESQSIQQGGSTVTQQLVRNLFLSHSQSYERKLTELLYAYQLERKLSKEEIIELYTNIIFFQNGVYGVEAASQYYFSKSAEELTVAETAFLSAIPNNPNMYNPLLNMDQTHKRKEWILQKMFENERINEETYTAAIDEKIELNLSERIDSYPDYVTYIHHEFEQLVSLQDGYQKKIDNARSEEEKQKYQNQLDDRVQILLKSGIKIETALDTSKQTIAVKAVESTLGNSGIQGATAIIDHRENELIAITGGTNYEKHNFHRGFQAYRQPGSAIKPLLVFAPYIEETNSSEQTIIDASSFSKNGYSPKNFGGASYGRVTMEAAFKHSYNTAAVRLLDQISPKTGFSYLNNFNFERLTNHDVQLPAALGGLMYGMSVLELTSAYSVFSTKGIYTNPKGIRQITDKDGNTLYTWPATETRVWSENTNEEVRKMMSRVVKEGTGRRASYSTSGYIGGKTGTTNNTHDIWFIGTTDRYTAGVWLGLDQPGPITSASNQNMHTNLWRNIMSQID